MGYIVRMPALGPETKRGTLLEWTVLEGESVSTGEAIADVATEPDVEPEPQSDAESGSRVGVVEARAGGVLRRTYLEGGESVPPGTPIGIVAPTANTIEDLEAEAATDLEAAAERVENPWPSPAESGTGAAARTVETGTARRGEHEMPGRSVSATNAEGMRGHIEAGSFEWAFDEPELSGGTETGPTPVDVFLGGLAACLSLSTRYQATKRDASVDEIRVDVDAAPERGSVERIDATIRIDADEDDETVEHIVTLAERGCHVSQLLRDDLSLTLAWERR
ncbi:OsmC family protein [Natrinema caseinilyticum]|uniref:OsmC family protein n=1 Tax=Natrinema caseinilyticum TaxID=2961570 RepID=UPI0020C1DC13|nr:OsmC family protein [Natrinema caseinilyticum]